MRRERDHHLCFLAVRVTVADSGTFLPRSPLQLNTAAHSSTFKVHSPLTSQNNNLDVCLDAHMMVKHSGCIPNDDDILPLLVPLLCCYPWSQCNSHLVSSHNELGHGCAWLSLQ